MAKQMCDGSKIKITRKYVNASPFSKFAVMSSNKQSSSSQSLDLEAEHVFGAKQAIKNIFRTFKETLARREWGTLDMLTSALTP